MPSVGSDIHSSRGIVRDTFCGQCGYNLYTRPIIGRCPECGGEYDTRPQAMRGIFLPQDLKLPLGSYALGVLSAMIGGPALYFAIKDGATNTILLAIVFSLFAVVFLWIAVRRTIVYVRHRMLVRQVRRSESKRS